MIKSKVGVRHRRPLTSLLSQYDAKHRLVLDMMCCNPQQPPTISYLSSISSIIKAYLIQLDAAKCNLEVNAMQQ